MAQHRVLIVEDDPHFRELLAQLLQEEGYAVETADSVLGVIGLVRSLRPSAILLDLGLPYRSGASLLTDLRGDPQTRDVPILIVTAQPEALMAERRAMVDAVIEKPRTSRPSSRPCRRPASERRRRRDPMVVRVPRGRPARAGSAGWRSLRSWPDGGFARAPDPVRPTCVAAPR